MTGAPIMFVWREQALCPLNTHWMRKAEAEFGDGEMVEMVRHEERSMISHRHYFACVREGWKNLPDHLSDEFPSPEALRKKTLIRCGYHDTSDFVLASHEAALKLASWLSAKHEYAVIDVQGYVVRLFEAKSQSTRAMGKKEFAASKDAVLGAISDLIGVPVESLKESGARA